MAFPLPYPKFRAFVDVTNLPLVGGKLYSYISDGMFSTTKNLYSDEGGTTPLSNPVILDSNGEAGIFGVGLYDLVLKDSLGNPMWTAQGINFGGDATAATNSEWIVQSGPFTYLSGTTFSVTGDQTGTYQSGRRIKFTVTGGTDYALITNVGFSGNTTVTIASDGIPLDSGLSAVSVGILGITPAGATSMPFWPEWFVDINGNGAFQGSLEVNSLSVDASTHLDGDVFINNGLAYRPLNLQTHSLTKDDFFGGSKVSLSEIGELGWGMQNASETVYIDSETNHPGIVRMTTTGSAYLTQDTSGIAQGPQLLPSEMWETMVIARANQTDNTILCRFGWFKKNSALTSPPTDGIYIEKLTTDLNWFLVCRAGSTSATRQDTGAPVNTNFTRFRLRRVNSTTIGLTVDNGTEVTVTDVAHTPTIGLTAYFYIQRFVSGTKTFDIDYWDTFFNAISR